MRNVRPDPERSSDDGNRDDTDQSAKVPISENFPERVRKVRVLLIKFLNLALKACKDAHIRYDRLIVNGCAYEYDFLKEKPVPIVSKK